MIGVPKRPAIDTLQSPMLEHPHAAGSSAALESEVCGDRIRAAQGADSLISLVNALPHHARVVTDRPIIGAFSAAERAPPGRDLNTAVPAEGASFWSTWQRLRVYASGTGTGAVRTHGGVILA